MWSKNKISIDKCEWSLDTERQTTRSVIMENNRNIFILKYGTPLMHEGTLHKDLGTMVNTTSAEKLSSGEYYPPVDVRGHVEGALEIIWQVADKVKSGYLSIFISTEDYIKYCRKVKYSTSSSISGLHFGHRKTAALYKS